MIDFYKKADERKKGEREFVSDEIEERIMMFLVSKRIKKRESASKGNRGNIIAQSGTAIIPTYRSRGRAFCDVFYESV